MFQSLMPRKTLPYLAVFALFVPCLVHAQTIPTQNVVGVTAKDSREGLAYADLVDLAESAPLVLSVEIRDAIKLPPKQLAAAQAQGASPPPDGFTRAYVEARGITALRGAMPAGMELRYLADVPSDAKGRVISLKKARAILFARAGAGGSGEIQLIASDAQRPWSAPLEARITAVLAELAAPPPQFTGITMALYQAGALAGDGETQIFLSTRTGTPAAIIVQHKSGQPPRWSLSLSEVVDASGLPPAPETLLRYRLSCMRPSALPETLPPAANVGEAQADRDRAAADYAMVRADLASCERLRH